MQAAAILKLRISYLCLDFKLANWIFIFETSLKFILFFLCGISVFLQHAQYGCILVIRNEYGD